jgi:pimeloyl-ACP methyl ester carboxylesterase
MVGHSLGAGQVLSVAAAFPELVEWAVSIDGLGPPPAALQRRNRAAQELVAWLDGAEASWGRPMREYSSVEEMATRRRALNVRMPEEWALHLARHGSRRGPGGGLVWKSDPANHIAGPVPFCEESLMVQFRRVRCPVSVLTGQEHDTWSDLSSEDIERRMAALSVGRHRFVEGAGHYIHLERPGEVLAEVEAMATGKPA